MSHRCISGPAIVVVIHSGFDRAGALNHFRAHLPNRSGLAGRGTVRYGRFRALIKAVIETRKS
jgi:hypothetical protein